MPTISGTTGSSKKHDNFIERNVYKNNWARVEDTMGEFKPLSKIVIGEGGWDDRKHFTAP